MKTRRQRVVIMLFVWSRSSQPGAPQTGTDAREICVNSNLLMPVFITGDLGLLSRGQGVSSRLIVKVFYRLFNWGGQSWLRTTRKTREKTQYFLRGAADYSLMFIQIIIIIIWDKSQGRVWVENRTVLIIFASYGGCVSSPSDNQFVTLNILGEFWKSYRSSNILMTGCKYVM